MIATDRCLRLQDYAARVLADAKENSWLAQHLATFSQSRLQELFLSRVSTSAGGQIPAAVRELLGRYWLQSIGLCVSYHEESRNYELRYLIRGRQGFVVERSAFPGDGRLGTLLRLVRRVEHLHFCALSGQPVQQWDATPKSDSSCVITDSDVGYRVQIGEEIAYAPLAELVPAAVAWAAERVLPNLQQLLDLHSKWTLRFCDAASVSLVHADDPEQKFVFAWRGGVAATAQEAKPAILQAHETLLRAWLPEKIATAVELGNCDLFGKVLIKWKDRSDQTAGYWEIIPFTRKSLQRIAPDIWSARAAAFQRLIDQSSGRIFSTVGVWTNPIYQPRQGGSVQFNTRWLSVMERPQWVPFEEYCRKLEQSLHNERDVSSLLGAELARAGAAANKEQ